ncbi:sorting and assembly machinery component 50 homolog isoform X2 [Artemia franciscana]|uniref:Bacterial surface antigen (D15) domain-containing protein n=1 Tax=Artemia franciscana TaxID=6661 RepID=A0AA88HJ66_ARTSF|nr:hypothetical protein QYM36_011607 [Artemia franciscana]
MDYNETNLFWSPFGFEMKSGQLETVKATVDKVHIDGVRKTKEDILVNAVNQMFEVNDFTSVLLKSKETKSILSGLGCFKKVDILIDTSQGPGASPDGLEVTFLVTEYDKPMGSINTVVGDNEGSVVIGGHLPNLKGRGESLSLEYSHGTKKSSAFNVTFLKPLHNKSKASWNASVFQGLADFPSSGYKELNRGAILNFDFNSVPLVRHTVSWEGVWRNLRCINRSTAFAVREHSGHSLKSSLKHALVADTRDSNVFPTEGVLFRVIQEYAGFGGGNIGFLKHDAEFQLNIPLFADAVFQAGAIAGHLQSLPNGKTYALQDRHFLGGPVNVRGFEMRGVGPHSDGNSIGAETYWAVGAHLFAPLPFLRGKGGLSERFRSHFFATAGNIGNFKLGSSLKENMGILAENFRLSYGIGIALKLAEVARVELNYCWPRRVMKGDRPNPGLQFGIGLHFL